MTIRSLAIEIASNYRRERDNEMNTLRKEIGFWQTALETAKSEHFRTMATSKMDEIICKRDKLLDDLGEFICNRLKSKWFQDGEKGTKYFLNMQKTKSRRSDLSALNSSVGVVDCPDEIDIMVGNYYRKLYEKGDSKIKNMDKVSDFLSNMSELNHDKIALIDRSITLNDLHETLKTCSDSAPGPDGIPYSIIKLTWKYFGPLLLDSWQYSLETGSLTHSHESSYLKLLPKEGKDLMLLKNWRPITLSNCDLKLLTKTLANRLTVGLECLISHNQTAYIKGRQITDNLHLLQYAVEKCVELDIPSMVVSLDAEKVTQSNTGI